MRASPSARNRALAWSAGSFAGVSSSATRPAAARMPACRIPPPSRLRYSRAFGDQIGRSGEHRSGGRTQRFGKAKHDRIGARRYFMHGNAQSRRRVKDPCAVHVYAHSTLVGCVANLAHCAHRVHRSARHIVGLLDGNGPGGRAVRAHRPQVADHLVHGEQSAFRRNGADHAAAEPCHHGELVVQQVGARIADHFLPVLGEQFDADGVAHGAGGDEDRGFLAGDFRGAFFQTVDGGVFAIDVVAHLGLEHRPPHCGCGPGDGVTAQIDHHSDPS